MWEIALILFILWLVVWILSVMVAKVNEIFLMLITLAFAASHYLSLIELMPTVLPLIYISKNLTYIDMGQLAILMTFLSILLRKKDKRKQE